MVPYDELLDERSGLLIFLGHDFGSRLRIIRLTETLYEIAFVGELLVIAEALRFVCEYRWAHTDTQGGNF
jgi:hypothetical protein